MGYLHSIAELDIQRTIKDNFNQAQKYVKSLGFEISSILEITKDGKSVFETFGDEKRFLKKVAQHIKNGT